MLLARHAGFLFEFLRAPHKVGAIAPSSGALADVMTAWLRLEEAKTVVEFGAGDGAMTPFVLSRLRPGATFFAMELSPKMCERFQRRHPGVTIYCDSAARVCDYLSRHGASHADCIVSALPWASFRPSLQDELMTATLQALRPGGRFTTFAYLQGLLMPGGRDLRRRLRGVFTEVSRSRIVWRNLPPAFVYQCVK